MERLFKEKRLGNNRWKNLPKVCAIQDVNIAVRSQKNSKMGWGFSVIHALQYVPYVRVQKEFSQRFVRSSNIFKRGISHAGS